MDRMKLYRLKKLTTEYFELYQLYRKMYRDARDGLVQNENKNGWAFYNDPERIRREDLEDVQKLREQMLNAREMYHKLNKKLKEAENDYQSHQTPGNRYSRPKTVHILAVADRGTV